MIILALDPGPEKTAALLYAVEEKTVGNAQMMDNIIVKEYLRATSEKYLVVCEQIESYGMPVGKSVFDTCVWTGVFWGASNGEFRWMPRKNVKMHLCNSMRAKDSNIRQALIDKFPATGGGKCPQIGTKKQPGPLFGISGDLWSALAVAVTYAETKL